MVLLSFISLPLYKVAVRPPSHQTKAHALSQKCCQSSACVFVLVDKKIKKKDPKTNDEMGNYYFFFFFFTSATNIYLRNEWNKTVWNETDFDPKEL